MKERDSRTLGIVEARLQSLASQKKGLSNLEGPFFIAKII